MPKHNKSFFCTKSPETSKLGSVCYLDNVAVFWRTLQRNCRCHFKNAHWRQGPVVLELQNCLKASQKSIWTIRNKKMDFSLISSRSENIVNFFLKHFACVFKFQRFRRDQSLVIFNKNSLICRTTDKICSFWGVLGSFWDSSLWWNWKFEKPAG